MSQKIISIRAACEEFRKKIISASRVGKVLVIDCASGPVPDFANTYTDSERFPAGLVFHSNKWRNKENYMKIVKEEENYDQMFEKGYF